MKKQTSSHALSFLTALLTFIMLASSTSADEIFVSPSGKDTNDGSASAPLATIAAAQAKARAIKQKTPDQAVTVYLRSGKYYLTEPVVFTPADSGTARAPITYKAADGETPQILGGVKLPDLKWTKHRGGIYKTKVPRGMVFETLFVNSKQQTLARYPNYTEDAPAFNGVASVCLSPKKVASWKDPTYGYFHAMHHAC